MGTGIGIDCRRCGNQLNCDDGFDDELRLCNRCKSIVSFEGGNYPKTLSDFSISELLEELSNRSYMITKTDFRGLNEVYLEWVMNL